MLLIYDANVSELKQNQNNCIYALMENHGERLQARKKYYSLVRQQQNHYGGFDEEK